jgi:hypothetical protein
LGTFADSDDFCRYAGSSGLSKCTQNPIAIDSLRDLGKRLCLAEANGL